MRARNVSGTATSDGKTAPAPAPTPPFSFEAATAAASALEREHDVVLAAEEHQCQFERLYEQEQAFIDFFTSGETKDIIELDVGGEMMSVKRSTLRLCEGSVLAKQFDDSTWKQQGGGADGGDASVGDDWVGGGGGGGGGGGNSDDDDDDLVLIEQPSYCFGKIIDHLRIRAINPGTEQMAAPPPVVAAHERCSFEAVVGYYFPGSESFILGDGHVLGGHDVPSGIVTDIEHAAYLETWVQEAGHPGADATDFRLLYRASRDGWRAADFHRLCDNQNPTLTVIQCTDGYIFGGYASSPWKTSGYGGWIACASSVSFLFTLHNPSGLPPTKMPLRGENTHHAMQGSTSRGPTFGNGPDLCVNDYANANRNSTHAIGKAYQLPAGVQDSQFLTGDAKFRAAEVEVYCLAGATPAATNGNAY
jgi:hypothetical protein